MEKIIDYIKRSIDEIKMLGGEPKKVKMNTTTFCMMIEELDDYNIIEVEKNGDKITFYVCGLKIERQEDIGEKTIFIVSEQ